MSKKNESSIVHMEKGSSLVAMMINGTSDSMFTLMRGVPSNDDKLPDEYLWSEVYVNGSPLQLSQYKSNPIIIEIPGTYKFRNDGTDDEQALIDMTVYR